MLKNYISKIEENFLRYLVLPSLIIVLLLGSIVMLSSNKILQIKTDILELERKLVFKKELEQENRVLKSYLKCKQDEKQRDVFVKLKTRDVLTKLAELSTSCKVDLTDVDYTNCGKNSSCLEISFQVRGEYVSMMQFFSKLAKGAFEIKTLTLERSQDEDFILAKGSVSFFK